MALETQEKVLVVDDSPTLRALVTHMVQALGERAVSCESADQCLDALGRERPSCILLDLDLVGMQGDDCCRKIRSIPELQHTPVIMMTGADSPDEVERCYAAGVDDFLPKPIRLAQLSRKMEAIRRARTGTAERRELSVRRLLVVGRDSGARALYGTALEDAGYQVMYGRGADEAQALLAGSGRRPDGILVDLEAPWGEARALVERIRAAAKTERGPLPLLAMTQSEPPREVLGGLQGSLSSPLVFRDGLSVDGLVRWLNTAFRRITLDLRVSTRVPHFSVIEFRKKGEKDWSSGFTTNVSAGGVCLKTLDGLPSASEVELRGLFPNDRSRVVRGMVAWANQLELDSRYSYPVGMGIRFVDIDEGPLQALLASRGQSWRQ